MNHRHEKLFVPKLPTVLGLLVGLIVLASLPSPASTSDFRIPDDTALRIRLDDTLNSVDSEVGDPFSARSLTMANTGMLECTVTSRKLICPARSKATPA